MRCALIEDATGKVLNVVEVQDGDGSTLEPGTSLVPTDVASPNDTYDKVTKKATRKETILGALITKTLPDTAAPAAWLSKIPTVAKGS